MSRNPKGPHSAGPTRPDYPNAIGRRTLLRGAAAIGGGIWLTACGSEDSTSGAGSLTVTDQRGEKITLDAPARRIVTLPMPAASLLIAVDRSAEHLVGMHDASWAAIDAGIMGSMFPDALAVPHDIANDEFAPNVESILALEPDVVVQWGDQGDGLTSPLTDAGLQVAGLTGTAQQDVAEWITLFAELLGKPDRGRQMNARIDKQYEEFVSLAEERDSPGPSILYFNQFTSELIVGATETSDDFYIKLIGATNAATGSDGVEGSGMVGVDIEQVLSWDPDIILLGNFDDAVPEDVYSDPVWKDLSAVRSSQVYKVPLGGYRWDPPSQESPLMWRWVTRIAYPERRRSDLRDQLRRDYQFLYGTTPSNAEIDTILWSDLNARSANYDQFDAP